MFNNVFFYSILILCILQCDMFFSSADGQDQSTSGTKFIHHNDRVYKAWGITQKQAMTPQNLILESFLYVSDVKSRVKKNVKKWKQLRTIVLGGPHFHESHIEHVHNIPSLKCVILENVKNPEKMLKKFRKKYPTTKFLLSQRSLYRMLISYRGRVILKRNSRIKEFPEISDEFLISVKAITRIDTHQYHSPGLTNEILNELKNTNSVTSLDLSETKIRQGDLEKILKNNPVEFLIMNGLKFSKLESSKKHRLRMKTLFLYRTNFSIKSVLVYPNLEFLDLVDAKVNNDDCKYFKRLEKLKSLRLSGTGIDEKGILNLGKLKALKEIHFDYDLMKTKAVETFIKRNPGVKVNQGYFGEHFSER